MLKLIIVLAFWAVIGTVFWRLKLLKRQYLEPVFTVVMILGIVALCQPYIFVFYNWGLATLLAGTAGYMFASHMK